MSAPLRALAACLVGLLILGSPGVWAQDFFGCLLVESYLNRERLVFGEVNEECEPTIHTVPFGNWGILSDIGPEHDGDQFRGWKDLGGTHREWNSCTSQYPGPHALYYNHIHNGQPAQYSEDTRLYHQVESWWLPYDPCSWGTWDGHVFNNFDHYNFVKELDPFGTNSTVAIVNWPDFTAVLSCPSGSDYCSTETDWHQPTLVTPDVLTAKAKVVFSLETTGRQW